MHKHCHLSILRGYEVPPGVASDRGASASDAACASIAVTYLRNPQPKPEVTAPLRPAIVPINPSRPPRHWDKVPETPQPPRLVPLGLFGGRL